MIPSTGHILEIFSSFQGEGPYAGVPQVFVRLGGCHLRCVYCDTPESWTREGSTLLTVHQVMESVSSRASERTPHSVSITGGEPLLQTDFLLGLLPALRKSGFRTYLDTSGTLPDRLERIIDHLDIIALDWKLASTPGAPVNPDDAERCVRIARRTEVFVKLVLLEGSAPAEVEDAARRIASVDPEIPVVLQPATPVHAQALPPTPAEIEEFRRTALRHLRNVRVLPQIHAIVGWK